MSAREPLYEGKAKIIFKGPEDGTLIQYFKDDATAFNAQKKDCLLYTSPSPRDKSSSRMPSSA